MITLWFFAIWSLGGGTFAIIGPFETKAACETQRQAVIHDIEGRNQVSRQCWSGTYK